MLMQKFNFKLHIMSPVHIGCDESYEPSSFKIDEQRKKLIEFDKYKFYESLSPDDKKRFYNICCKTDLDALIDLIKFISNKKVSGKEVDISSDIIASFNRLKQLQPNKANEIGKFQIQKTAFTSLNNIAYIPGSSLKGSLRTGFLNFKSQTMPLFQVNKSKELEQKLLNYSSFESDPFRLIKVSDFVPIENVKTKIIYAINRKKTSQNKGRGIPVILETICEESVFEGSITINKDSKIIREEININDLLSANHKFYFNLLKKENDVLQKIQASTKTLTFIQKAFGDKLNHTAFCIRIGKHCGAEAVTIEKYRKISIKGPKGRKTEEKSSTTIWLASEEKNPASNRYLIPLGWCILEII